MKIRGAFLRDIGNQVFVLPVFTQNDRGRFQKLFTCVCQMQVGLRTDKTLREAERILTTDGEYEKLLGTAQNAPNEQFVDKNPAMSVK